MSCRFSFWSWFCFCLFIVVALSTRLWSHVLCALVELVRLKAYGVAVNCFILHCASRLRGMNLVERARTARRTQLVRFHSGKAHGHG